MVFPKRILIIISLYCHYCFSAIHVSCSVLSDLLQRLTGIQAINGMQVIYEPFEVIYIQAFMVSYVRLSLAVLTLA